MKLTAPARLFLNAYSARCELSDLDGRDGAFQQRLRAALEQSPPRACG